MEYVYAAMLLHKAGKNVDEQGVKKVLEAAGVSVDASKIKALVGALDGVNIDKAIEKAAVTAPVVVAQAKVENEPTAKDKEKKEEVKEEKKEEEAAAGLGALFG